MPFCRTSRGMCGRCVRRLSMVVPELDEPGRSELPCAARSLGLRRRGPGEANSSQFLLRPNGRVSSLFFQ